MWDKKDNNTVHATQYRINRMQKSQNSPKFEEKIFLLCDGCLWTVTCLNKKYLEELNDISETEYSCPSCRQEELSSFPVTQYDSFRYNYSKSTGLEITFGPKNK